jgi:hypothetical protein
MAKGTVGVRFDITILSGIFFFHLFQKLCCTKVSFCCLRPDRLYVFLIGFVRIKFLKMF